MSRQMADRWILRLAGAALVICAVMPFAGCVSTKGAAIQGEFATASEVGTKGAADRQYQRLRETQDQLMAVQVSALKTWVAELDANSTSVAEGAENHDRYWLELRRAEQVYADEVRKADADRAELHQWAAGFQVQARMQAEQDRLASETAKAVLRAGLGAMGSIGAAAFAVKPEVPGGDTTSPAPELLKPTSGGNGQ